MKGKTKLNPIWTVTMAKVTVYRLRFQEGCSLRSSTGRTCLSKIHGVETPGL